MAAISMGGAAPLSPELSALSEELNRLHAERDLLNQQEVALENPTGHAFVISLFFSIMRALSNAPDPERRQVLTAKSDNRIAIASTQQRINRLRARLDHESQHPPVLLTPSEAERRQQIAAQHYRDHGPRPVAPPAKRLSHFVRRPRRPFHDPIHDPSRAKRLP